MIYLFLAQGFEETEALCPLDLLRRAGLEVTTVGIGGRMITGAHGIPVQADMADTEWRDEAPAMVILPGGMPGAHNLDASPVVEKAICAVTRCDGYLAAICAAPMIPGKRGYLRGKRAVCFPGYEKELKGAVLASERVVRDGKFITAAGMGVSTEFGLALVAAWKGQDAADGLRRAILAD